MSCFRQNCLGPRRAPTVAASAVLLRCGVALLALVAANSRLDAQSGAGADGAGELIKFKILVTTDVHGWMNPAVNAETREFRGGLTRLAAAWRSREGYDPEVHRNTYPLDGLVLDCGDMWTGRPESTLLQGSPLIAAFNALAYDAAALGNHEFDFGPDILKLNARRMRAPILAANLGRRAHGPDLDFCRKSILVNVRGLPVGIIGLVNEDTPKITYPTQVRGLTFNPYAPAVRAEAQELLARGAKVLIVIGHVSRGHLRELAAATADLPIRLFFGGHNHARELEVVENDPATEADDQVFLSAGQFGEVYGRVEVVFTAQGELKAHDAAIVPIEGSLENPPDPEDRVLTAIADDASAKVAPELQVVVGQVREPLPHRAPGGCPLGQLVTEAWLERFTDCDFAINNRGSIRQPLSPGPVTMGDVYGVLPFASELMVVEMTAQRLRDLLAAPSLYVSGLRARYRLQEGRRVVTELLDRHGQPLDETKRYRVVTTDFLYLGGDGVRLQELSTNARSLETGWREPFVDYLRRRAGEGVGLLPGNMIPEN